ncbi:hypothetical protein BKG80_06790 [Mycobacteroides chelonae]|nr:hypothetical protein [Mycobacteroides chelonae]OHU41030.1 hypothetical protein BKG80_06790 [Mycobacteroides chelonae]
MLVWIRLALAPWWIQWFAYSALIFIAAGIPVAVINREDKQGQWLGWWIGIAVVALVVGLVWALAARSRAPQLHQMLDGLTPAQYRQASKAVLFGPIPSDPAIRRAAAHLAQNTIERQLRVMSPAVRKFLIGSMAVNVLIQVGISATGATISFTTVFNAAVFTGTAVYWWLYPPLLEARAQLLAGAALAPNIGIAAPPMLWSYAAPDAGRYQGQPEGTYPPPQV